MRVVVTGTSGQPGAEIAARLATRGDEAVGLDAAPGERTA